MNFPSIKNFFSKKKQESIFQKSAKAFQGGGLNLIDLFATATGYGGDKFYKGFGMTKDFQVVNLKLLQYRSIQLLRENLYTNALFTRLETKVINKGLTLNCAPMLEILGKEFDLTDDQLRDWSRLVEARFKAWSRDKEYISWNGEMDFSKMQRAVYNTSHLSGDCLVIVTLNKQGLPVIKLVDGFYVSTPILNSSALTKRIIHGVELDSDSKEIAYWVENGKGGHTRVPAYGRGTKRRRAWLVKNTQQRIDDIRGLPLIAVMLQNLNEAGKYLDSEQRAALVNSYLAMTRNRDPKQGAQASGSRRRGALNVDKVETKTAGNVQFEQQQPGLFLANLAQNEEVKSFDTKRPNINFGPFMEAVLKPCAYANEIPPEIFFMEYGNNFSASRQANLDFKEATDKKQYSFSRQFNDPVFVEFLTGEVLNGSIKAPGYINSLKIPSQFHIRNAWQNTQWRGLPQTSVDIKKMVQALQIVEEKGWLTNDNISSTYFNSDFFDNQRRRKTENEALVSANDPLKIDNGEGGENNASVLNKKYAEISQKLEDFEAAVEVMEEKLDNVTVDKG